MHSYCDSLSSQSANYTSLDVNPPATPRSVQLDLEHPKVQFVTNSLLFVEKLHLPLSVLKLVLTEFEIMLTS